MHPGMQMMVGQQCQHQQQQGNQAKLCTRCGGRTGACPHRRDGAAGCPFQLQPHLLAMAASHIARSSSDNRSSTAATSASLGQ